MAYTNIKKPSDYFDTKLYTGDDTNNREISLGLTPDLTWIKARNVAYGHTLFDRIRGLGFSLSSNSTNADRNVGSEFSWSNSGCTTDSFTVDRGSNESLNETGRPMVAWNWKAGTTSGLSGGTITPSSYSINSTSGFGIYKYTGTGSAGTIASGLPSVKCFIIKALDASNNGWVVYHQDLGTNKYLQLDETSAPYTGTSQFNDTAPTTSTTNSLISVGTAGSSNNSGRDYIMYAFSELQGFSKFGSYTGNGNADGTFVYTGFKPAFVMIKETSNTGNWCMSDNKRDGYNPTKNLYADVSHAENTANTVDHCSNGFKIRSTGGSVNTSGSNHIYMAFAEQPLVGDNPATAR